MSGGGSYMKKSKEEIQLSSHFDYRKLLRFVIAPVCNMVFVSIYGIVDGFFVSNYVGSIAFASLNLTLPYIMMIAAVGFMFGSGGNALVSMYLGRKEDRKAREYFSMIVYSLTAAGLILSGISAVFAPQISAMLGASEVMMPYCILYLRISMISMTFYMLMNLFQSFLITAEKPKTGLRITILAGCTNMFLDWLFVGMLRLGLAGAAFATVTSEILGGTVSMIMFLLPSAGNLRLVKTGIRPGVIAKACGNGASEFLANVSISVVGFMYNIQLMHYAGENGVAAYGVIMYVGFIFMSIYFGYSMGSSPVIAYNFGAQNRKELQNLFRKSAVLITAANISMVIIAELLTGLMVKLFVGYDPELSAMTARGMHIFSVCFILMGYNIFASAFFTALNNGFVSAVISVARTLVLQLVMIFTLPIFFGLDGLWAVTPSVEAAGMLVSVFFIIKNRGKYGYI